MSDAVESYRKSVLNKIQEVSAQRQEGYGSALESFSRIGTMWSAYLTTKFGVQIEIKADDVGFLMELFKMCREMNKPDFENGIDGTNYALFGYALSHALRIKEAQATARKDFIDPYTEFGLFTEEKSSKGGDLS